MKRLMNVLLFFSFIVLLSFFVSGQITSHSADDVLFRISPHIPSGAHVENATMNTAVYTPIYYSDIFSSTYSGSTTGLRVCSGTNTILGFAPNPVQPGTNGHAETPDLSTSGYLDICYGTLTCTYSSTGTCSGSGNPQPVISISGTTSGSGVTNAHVAPATGNGAYTGKICCSTGGGTGGTTGLGNARWFYGDGTPIGNTDPDTRICPSVVKTRVSAGTSVTGQVSFQLWDDDGATGDDAIGNPVPINPTGTPSYAEATFDLAATGTGLLRDLLQTELNEGGEGNELELYFKASSTGVSDLDSYTIEYVDDVRCSSQRPLTSIVAPLHRGVYFTNTQLVFIGSCTNNPTSYEWTITQDGQTQPVTFPGNNAPHTFNSAGQANVKLKCTNAAGYSEAEAQILVVDPMVTKTLAYINEPAFNSFSDNTYSGPPYLPALVNFKATHSFVVKVTPQTNACPTVECLGGNCLLNTQNIPTGVAGCTGNNIPITPYSSTNKFDTMEFTWRFWDNNNYNLQMNPTNALSEGFQDYEYISENLNDKHMSVTVKHTSGAEASFQRDFTLGRCLDEGTKYYTLFHEPPKNTYLPNDACMGPDVTARTPDDCCHLGYECEPDPQITGKYSCQLQNRPIIFCRDAETSTECTRANNNPAIPRASLPSAPSCSFLECYWITSGTGANTCGVRATNYNTCGTNSDPRTRPPTQTCVWETELGNCINGVRTITYRPGAGSVGTCNNPGTANVRCGALSFELGFFGRTQFLMSVVLIIAIYLIYLVFNSKGIKRHEKIK